MTNIREFATLSYNYGLSRKFSTVCFGQMQFCTQYYFLCVIITNLIIPQGLIITYFVPGPLDNPTVNFWKYQQRNEHNTLFTSLHCE